MRIFGLGIPELLVIIIVIVLLIFGPKNLPKLGRTIGKTIKNLREGMNEGKKETSTSSAQDVLKSDAEDVVTKASVSTEIQDEGSEQSSSNQMHTTVKKVVRKKVD